VLRWGGEGALAAHLVRLDPSARTKVSALGIEEQRVEAVFALDSPAPGLGNGYAVFLRVAVWRGAEVVQVPVGALFRQGDDWAVFTVEDGRARLRRLRIGRQNGETAEVLEGLAPGVVVIRHPADDVADGVQVVEAMRE
jgi:HlyD family secretion protein